MRAQDYIDLESRYGAHNYRPIDVVIERAEGVWVYDIEGKVTSIVWPRIRR